MSMITSMDRDGDGVDRGEFVCGMLIAMGVIAEAEAEALCRRFDELDVDNSGRLDSKDLELLAAQEEERAQSRRRGSLRQDTRPSPAVLKMV